MIKSIPFQLLRLLILLVVCLMKFPKSKYLMSKITARNKLLKVVVSHIKVAFKFMVLITLNAVAPARPVRAQKQLKTPREMMSFNM